MRTGDEDVGRLRSELDTVDRALIEAAARRQQIVAEIGRVKHARGQPLRDFQREAEVLAHVRERAGQTGLDPALAERLMRELIEASLTAQEQDRVRLSNHGEGQTALIIGGNGRMGRWFARFLLGQGFHVTIADPGGAPGNLEHVQDWTLAIDRADLVVVATPLRASAAILGQMVTLAPPGLVIDIASLKSPLIEPLINLADRGVAVCSTHPMFGPDARLLSGRQVLLMPVADNRQALARAEALFKATEAHLIELTLDEHDRRIAWILGLSHAINLLFADTLTRSGLSLDKLGPLASTTFARQLAITADVSRENPHLYFEIQHLNTCQHEVLSAMETAASGLREIVKSGDEAAFVELMQRSADWLQVPKSDCIE